jgi:hypothetical protein
MSQLTRREFIRMLAAGSGALAVQQVLAGCGCTGWGDLRIRHHRELNGDCMAGGV